MSALKGLKRGAGGKQEEEQSFPNVLIVTGLPQAEPAKLDALRQFLLKKLKLPASNDLPAVAPSNLQFIDGPDGKNKPHAFLEYAKAQDADRTLAAMKSFRLDRSHTVHLFPMNELSRCKQTPDTYEEKDLSELTDRNIPDRWDWLLESEAKEQFAMRTLNTREVCWYSANAPSAMQSYHKKENCDQDEGHAAWSPQGTYLILNHVQGIQILAGNDFRVVHSLPHPGVQVHDVSPCERYLVTWAPTPNKTLIWDIRLGQMIKSFPGGPKERDFWPVLVFSHDEKYFAERNIDGTGITVYDTKTCTPIKAACIEAKGIAHFQWCPTDNMLSYWLPELDHQPASVVISRLEVDKTSQQVTGWQKVVTKQLYGVKGLHMDWQTNGDFLCVKVDRVVKATTVLSAGSSRGAGELAKIQKKPITSFELFRIRGRTGGKGVPVETVDIEHEVTAFAWEPKGLRFALCFVDEKCAASKARVGIYSMMSTSDALEPKRIKLTDPIPANHLFWSPRGNHLILAGLGRNTGMNGNFEFCSVNDKNVFEVYASAEHSMCRTVQWSPSGRYMCSSVTTFETTLSNGFKIWSFQGVELMNVSRESFWYFNWRPRPPCQLTKEQVKAIEKNLPKRIQAYEAEIARVAREQDFAARKDRQEKWDEWHSWRSKRLEALKPSAEHRARLRGYDVDSPDYYETVIEEDTEVVEVLSENPI
eukprot:NODE_233_length_2420_cov_114.120202_g180_i0.p1 GENE.NODE_233_length_2420_cov_114.120202_g180_i0~~NODE_233_length_2420_cov_114.120202_g180_i0.p1  ORF type:complete len:702 (+),score=259.86 NODE_233_length_2420_cov_114.120202_g180_i0:228-2333(+)